jgi:biotin transport system substrate-specific component
MTTAIARRPIVDRVVPARVTESLAGTAVLVLAGALFVALTAQVRIPLGFTPVPITGQTLGVLLVGAALGARRGVASVVLYLLLGFVGFPVFTNGAHGVAHLWGATGGYLVGFVAAAAIAGRLADMGGDRRIPPAALGMAIASIVIYFFGLLGLMIVLGVGPVRALELGLYPFVVGDVLKAVLAALLLPAAWWAVERVDRAGC